MDHVKPPDFVTFINKGFGVCYTKFLVLEDQEYPNLNMKIIRITNDSCSGLLKKDIMQIQFNFWNPQVTLGKNRRKYYKMRRKYLHNSFIRCLPKEYIFV